MATKNLGVVKGTNGVSTYLQVNSTHIQYKDKDHTEWTDLIALSELKGAKGDTGATGSTGQNGTNGQNGQDGTDGVSAYLQVNSTHIQYKDASHPEWTDLVALSTLKGADATDITEESTTSRTITCVANKIYNLGTLASTDEVDLTFPTSGMIHVTFIAGATDQSVSLNSVDTNGSIEWKGVTAFVVGTTYEVSVYNSVAIVG